MLEGIIKLLKSWIELKKTGNITINFFKGTPGVIKIEETKKVDELMNS